MCRDWRLHKKLCKKCRYSFGYANYANVLLMMFSSPGRRTHKRHNPVTDGLLSPYRSGGKFPLAGEKRGVQVCFLWNTSWHNGHKHSRTLLHFVVNGSTCILSFLLVMQYFLPWVERELSFTKWHSSRLTMNQKPRICQLLFAQAVQLAN